MTSFSPVPTPAAIARAGRAYPAAYLPYTRFELAGRVLGAPAPGRAPASDRRTARLIESSPYADMFALARRLGGANDGSYAIAQRIERYLRSGYTYDERPPRARYPLEQFLFVTHRGYCQQFSGAMALMLRMDGVPARIAAGFKPGVYDPVARVWRVRALDAHSWVEVYLAGIGWVSFDPTPPRPVAGAGAGTGLISKGALLGAGASGGQPGAPAGATRATAATRRGSRGAPPVWQAVGAALALALLGTGAWRALRARRLRQAFAGDAAGAVAELSAALASAGYRFERSITLAQLEARLALTPARGACPYIGELRGARYGTAAAARPSAQRRAAARRALGRGGPVRRLRALLALPPRRRL